MVQEVNRQRLLAMTAQERRWLDNIKKAFYESDLAMQSSAPEDRCLGAAEGHRYS
jgi:hypothetical protein